MVKMVHVAYGRHRVAHTAVMPLHHHQHQQAIAKLRLLAWEEEESS